MVRLKDHRRQRLPERKPSFNSKMVRLKAATNRKRRQRKKFQFQNGAIKRLVSSTGNTCAEMFQFQNGAIKRAQNRMGLVAAY